MIERAAYRIETAASLPTYAAQGEQKREKLSLAAHKTTHYNSGPPMHSNASLLRQQP